MGHGGCVEHVLGGALRIYAAPAHAGHPVGDLLGQGELVQRQQAGPPARARKVAHTGKQLQLMANVEVGGGFVERHHRRVLGDGAGEQHALALAVAYLHEVALAQLPGAHGLHGTPYCLSVGLAQRAQGVRVGDAARLHHVQAAQHLAGHAPREHHREVARQLVCLEGARVAPVEQHAAAQGRNLACDCLEQGRLARSVGSHKTQHLAGHEVERDVAHHAAPPVSHIETARL